MDRMIYTAMNGAKQSFDQQAVVSNNLANVSTPGFRAQLSEMQSYQVKGDGLATRTLPLAATPGVDLTPGPIMTTGRTLDVAIRGEGFFAVQNADGSLSYTRRGDLQMDQAGMLSIEGKPLMGENGPILIPLDSEISIGGNGTISVIQAGMSPDTIAEVERIRVVSAAGAKMERAADGFLVVAADEQGNRPALPANDNGQITAGALEGSNASATEMMVEMINVARRYEMQMKVIGTADENAQTANKLLSVS